MGASTSVGSLEEKRMDVRLDKYKMIADGCRDDDDLARRKTRTDE